MIRNNKGRINDFFIDASLGNSPGMSTLFKFGRCSIGATEGVVWDGSGVGAFYDYHFVDTAEYLNVVSDNTNDNATGTGARVLLVYGLDSDYNEQFESIILNGTTPVQTVNQYLRNYRAFVLTSGTNAVTTDANLGTISITGATTGNLYSQIVPHAGQTLMTVYTVPANKVLAVTGFTISVGQGKEVLARAMVRNGPTLDYAFSNKYTVEVYEQSFLGELKSPLIIPEKSDICFTAVTTSGTVEVSASYGGVLIDI